VGLWREEGGKRRWIPEREGDREERSVGAAAAVAATVDAIAANANAMRGTTHERRVCDAALTY
jgi:hypothetical protein